MFAAVICLVTLGACVGEDDSSNGTSSTVPTYKSYGEWPQYTGKWGSLSEAVGSKLSSWAYLDITIGKDATFSGSYKKYAYSSTWNMPTAWGNIPTPIYVSDGIPKAVSGAIDFTKLTGEISFQDIGATSFTLTILSDNDVSMSFPSGFTFTVANIKR